MREQINNNPVIQIGLVAVLLVAAGFMLLTSMGGGEGSASSEATATVETPAGTSSVTVTTPVEGEATTSAPTSVGAVGLVSKPRLPKPVREAIADDRTVVLLVVKRGGIDDARVEAAVETLA